MDHIRRFITAAAPGIVSVLGLVISQNRVFERYRDTRKHQGRRSHTYSDDSPNNEKLSFRESLHIRTHVAEL